MNAPEKFLTWRWEDDDEEITKKLTYHPDSKRPNAGTFIMGKEDHTLGNLLRMQLLRDPGVRFAGYRIPHPLIFDCHVRVESMDSKLAPINVFESALADLQLETEILGNAFDEACAEFERGDF
jgi:DNA-directed RNA polymerase II subunit RPB11